VAEQQWCTLEKLFRFEDRDESLEVFKDGLLVIPQPFSKFPAHTPNPTAKLGCPPGFLNRPKEIHIWRKGIYVIEICVYQDEVAKTIPNLLHFF
jgi:hypothetical protein